MFFLANRTDLFHQQALDRMSREIWKEIRRFSATGPNAARGGMVTGVFKGISVNGYDKLLNVFIICRYRKVEGGITIDDCLPIIFDEIPNELLDFHLFVESFKKNKNHEIR